MSTKAQSLMFSILILVEEINRVASRINEGKEDVFGVISLPMPKFTPPELGFIRTTSWLYVLYFEAGRVSVQFLFERFSAFGLDPERNISPHLGLVQQMRTFLQHNLDPRKEQNRRIQEDCEKWLEEHCKTRVPELDRQWNRCLEGLLK